MTVAIIVISILVAFWLITIKYKKELKKTLDSKQHPLKIFYGMGMFICDKTVKKSIGNNPKINTLIDSLVVKDNTERERYLYTVKKITICILVMFIVGVIAVCVGISEKQNDKGEIQSLNRSTVTDKEIDVIVGSEDGKQDKININIPKKKYSEKEIISLLNKASKQLQKIILGKNKTLNHVDKPLNLPGSVGKNNITVNWEISDATLLSYEGKLSDKISKKGELVTLTATLTMEKISRTYVFSVNLFPESKPKSIGEKVQEKIDKEDVYTKKVLLPASINGKKVSYRYPVDNNGIKILIIGIVVAFVMYFLKDNDLKKDVEKRNAQLMSDYPELVTSVMLYYEAGLSLKSAFEKIVSNYKERKRENNEFRYAYEELEMSLNKMKTGVSESVAIAEFGKRCNLHSYTKFTGLIEQNMKRGTRELTVALRNELNEALLEKKVNMQKKGGQISTKLMGPMIIMLIIAIAIIMVPAFMSMGV